MYKEKTIEKVIQLLNKGGKYSTKQLSETFDQSTRNIRYILKELISTGIVQKEKTLYYIPEDYRNTEIYERVSMSVALMLSLYKHAVSKPQESVLENFKILPKETDAFIFDLNFEEIANETYFNQITNAIMDRLAIEFEYKNAKGIVSVKNVYPVKITNLQTYWYLIGYDLEDNKIKTFYFNNISNLKVQEESYLYEKQINDLHEKSSQMRSAWFNDDVKSVKLRVTDAAITYIKRQNNDMFEIAEETASELTVNMKYYNNIEVLTFVKKWLPYIYIIDNDHLNTKLQEILQIYITNNTKI